MLTMVSSRVDRAQAVSASWETRRNSSAKNPVHRGIVQTLEERESVRVRSGRLVERGKELDGDVGVTNDCACTINLCIRKLKLVQCVEGEGCKGRTLRSRVVVRRGVHEVPGDHVRDGHLDREGRVGWDGVSVLRVDELGGRHLVCADDTTHLAARLNSWNDLADYMCLLGRHCSYQS